MRLRSKPSALSDRIRSRVLSSRPESLVQTRHCRPKLLRLSPPPAMSFREEKLGTAAVFLLPSLKLKEPPREGSSPEIRLHTFLMDNFGGYTAQAGNIFGYWRDPSGKDSYGEHREFTVALSEEAKLPLLKS